MFAIRCLYCGEMISEIYELQAHATCEPKPSLTPQPKSRPGWVHTLERTLRTGYGSVERWQRSYLRENLGL